MKEIEVKYLVDVAKLNAEFTFDKDFHRKMVLQGYMSTDGKHTSRANFVVPILETIKLDNSGLQLQYDKDCIKSKINVKGPRDMETRDEFEYEIPIRDALAMINMTDNKIFKIRTRLSDEWDIDVYFDENNVGLVVAEKEYKSEKELREDTIPAWCIRNITYDDRFYNRNLSHTPITKFSDYEVIISSIIGDKNEFDKWKNGMKGYRYIMQCFIDTYGKPEVKCIYHASYNPNFASDEARAHIHIYYPQK